MRSVRLCVCACVCSLLVLMYLMTATVPTTPIPAGTAHRTGQRSAATGDAAGSGAPVGVEMGGSALIAGGQVRAGKGTPVYASPMVVSLSLGARVHALMCVCVLVDGDGALRSA